MQSSSVITASDFTWSRSLFNPKLITELANIATRITYYPIPETAPAISPTNCDP